MAVASDLTQGETLVEDLALQLTVGDTVTLPADVDAAISKVTLADVQKVRYAWISDMIVGSHN